MRPRSSTAASPSAERVELPDGVADRAGSEQTRGLEALDPGGQAREGVLGGRAELGREGPGREGLLHADREQRGVLDGEPAEDADARLDEIGARVGR